MMEKRERYEFLGKWTGYLFVISIASVVASVMKEEFMADFLPVLYRIGQIIFTICTLGYSIALIKLGVEEERYKTAGIFNLITSAVGAVSILLVSMPGFAVIIVVISVICGLVAEYNECMAHSTIFLGIDNEMSHCWEELWKWYIGVLIAILVCVLLVAIIPIVGAILILITAIISIGISILKMSYLYKTSKFFKGYEAV